VCGSPTTTGRAWRELGPEHFALRPGAKLGPYRLDRRVRADNQGELWLAEEQQLDRRVALRIVSEQVVGSDAVARFVRAATAAAALDQPNVLPIYRVGEDQGVAYAASRWTDGVTLSEELAKHGALRPARAAEIVRQVGDALESTHEHGIAHGEVGPSSVELDRDHAYLTGFGLGGFSDDRPGLIDAPSREEDVRALGRLLEVLLGGRPGPRRARIPPELRDVVSRARGDRPPAFATAGELADAAVQAAGPYRPAEEYAAASIRRRWFVGAPLAAGLALIVASAVWLTTGSESPDDNGVRATVEKFTHQRRGSGCELLTDRLVQAFGGPSACRRRLARRSPATLSIDSIDVSGDVAEVTATEPNGDAYRLGLARQNGTWAIYKLSPAAPGS
jgi:hypothetical protein